MSCKRLIAACVASLLAAAATARAQPAAPKLARSASEAGPSLADLIQSGDRRAAQAIIDSGADVNRAQPDGTTPLHWAAYRVDQELVQRLLKRGARANVVNRYGASPLAEAVKVASVPLVGILLEAGADAN